MLLGDYELSSLRDTTGITVLFVIFTSVGVVILLNVLIAIVSDSYERSMLSSALIFGRARALFVAQNGSLEAFLRPGDIAMFMRKDGSARSTWSRYLLQILRWAMLVAILATAGNGACYLASVSVQVFRGAEGNGWEVVVGVVIFLNFLVLMTGWCTLLGFSIESIIRKICPGSTANFLLYPRTLNLLLVHWFARVFLGMSRTKKQNAITSRDEWSGRLNYIRTMVAEIVEESQNRTAAEISALETVSLWNRCI